MEHHAGAVLLPCRHFVPSTHTRNTKSVGLKVFTRQSGLCSQNGALCECVAVLMLHVATALCWLSAGVVSGEHVGLQCWQPVSRHGLQQLVKGFFAWERQAQASSSQGPNGMF